MTSSAHLIPRLESALVLSVCVVVVCVDVCVFAVEVVCAPRSRRINGSGEDEERGEGVIVWVAEPVVGVEVPERWLARVWGLGWRWRGFEGSGGADGGRKEAMFVAVVEAAVVCFSQLCLGCGSGVVMKKPVRE